MKTATRVPWGGASWTASCSLQAIPVRRGIGSGERHPWPLSNAYFRFQPVTGSSTFAKRGARGPHALLLADAEPGENPPQQIVAGELAGRSEERRVGKECRSR